MNVSTVIHHLSKDKEFSQISMIECNRISNHADVDSIWKIICDQLSMSDIVHPNSEVYQLISTYKIVNLMKVYIHWNGYIRPLSDIITEISQLDNIDGSIIEHYISDITVKNDGNTIHFNETMYGQIFEREINLLDRKKTKLVNWSPKVKKQYGELRNGDVTIIGTTNYDDGYIIINETGEIYDREKGSQNNFMQKCAVIGLGVGTIVIGILFGLQQF